MNELLDRVPPHDLRAESVVVGVLLKHPAEIDVLAPLVSSDEFFWPDRRDILNTILSMQAASEPVSAATVFDKMRAREGANADELKTNIQECIDQAVTPSTGFYYAGLVRKAARLRGYINLGAELIRQGYRSDASPDDLSEHCEMVLVKLVQDSARQQQSWAEAVATFDARPTGATYNTGIADLDAKLGGIEAGNFVILSGRPGAGKTSLATQIAIDFTLRQKVPVLFVSLEMSRTRLLRRMCSQRTDIPLSSLRVGRYTLDESRRIEAFRQEVMAAPLQVFYMPGSTAGEIASVVRGTVARGKAKIVFVDYVQKLKTPVGAESRHLGVAENVRGLCALGGQLGVPMIVMSQLRRETDRTKTLDLDLLAESAALEQEADIVVMVDREKTGTPAEVQSCVLLVAKNRDGVTGPVNVLWRGANTTFLCQDGRAEPTPRTTDLAQIDDTKPPEAAPFRADVDDGIPF